MAQKLQKSSLVPYSVVAVVLILGVAVFIKLFTGNSSSDVLGMYARESSVLGKPMTWGEKISSFFSIPTLRKDQTKQVLKRTRRVDIERRQRVSDFIKEIDGVVDDGGVSEFQALQKDANSL